MSPTKVIYDSNDVAKPKAKVAKHRLIIETKFKDVYIYVDSFLVQGIFYQTLKGKRLGRQGTLCTL